MTTRNGLNASQVDWQTRAGFEDCRFKPLVGPEVSPEFAAGTAQIAPGRSLPFHVHSHAQFDYILSGRAWARLGQRKVEVVAGSAVYIEAGLPHAYQTIGPQPLSYFYLHPCQKKGPKVDTEAANPDQVAAVDIPNLDHTRWVCFEDYEPLVPWEPSKGTRGIMWNSLFDSQRGNHSELMVGILKFAPGVRYSKHTHDQPEIFYCISGCGRLYADDRTFTVDPGTTVYVPPRQIHGGQNTANTTFKLIWAYGTESAGALDWSWHPAEDIYFEPQID